VLGGGEPLPCCPLQPVEELRTELFNRLSSSGRATPKVGSVSDSPSVLVLDSGELGWCCDALTQIGSDFALASADSEPHWPRDLLVTTPQTARYVAWKWRHRRLDARPRKDTSLISPLPPTFAAPPPRFMSPVWICVSHSDQPGVRDEMCAAGVDYWIGGATGEPDHDLFRLLVLQVLYEGAERRGELRVLCRHDIEYAASEQDRTRGRLMDLSRSGCRFLAAQPLESGTGVDLYLPGELDGDRHAYPATVQRCADLPSAGGASPRTSVVVSFSSSLELEQRLAGAMQRAEAQSPLGALRPVAETALTDRRHTPRHRYSGVAAITSLDAEEYCIAHGAELSMTGMRLAFHPGLDIGSELMIGLHAGQRGPALLVRGRVRHHDPTGLGVEFDELPAGQSRLLQALIGDLPHLDSLCTTHGDPRPILLCSVRV